MRWSRRSPRSRLPAEVLSALPMSRGERLLAVAQLADGTWAVATDRALVAGGVRLDWERTAHADWDAESAVLTIDPLGTAGDAPPSLRLEIDEPGHLPEVVRERVTASIVATRHVRLRGRAGVRVVARRAGSGELTWQVVVDEGLDPDDPQVRAAADKALAELRGELGA